MFNSNGTITLFTRDERGCNTLSLNDFLQLLYKWKRHHAINKKFSQGKKRRFAYQLETKDVKVKYGRGVGAAGHLAVLKWPSNAEPSWRLSQLTLKTHRGFLKSPFRSFVLTGDRRYTMSVFSAVLLNLRWRGPWSIRSAELVPVGAGTGMKSMVFKWTSPTLQQARRFLETTLVIPPVVRTDDWDNVWRCFSSHLFLFDARLSCEAVWAWRYTRPPTFTSQRGHAANPPEGRHNWLQHVWIAPLKTRPVKWFMLYYMIQRGWFGILLTPIRSSAKPAPQVSAIPLLEPSAGSTERQPNRIDYDSL